MIFGYNGRDGVVTDDNGLIYMRARYYSPAMKRFVNADIVAGQISNAITLNRFAYANGNPVSFIDPFGLWSLSGLWNNLTNWVRDTAKDVKDWAVDTYNRAKNTVVEAYNEAKDWVVDKYNYVKERVVDTYNDAKKVVSDFSEKAGNAFLNSIEAEVGVGYGFGKSFKVGCFEIEAQAYSDNFTVRLDDNELFMDNSGGAGISVNILDQKNMSIGFSTSYHHDYVDRNNECKEHHAWSNPFSVATCEHADKTPMIVTLPIEEAGSVNTDVSEDIVISISGATHIGIGYHYSVGFNLSQFWGEVWE